MRINQDNLSRRCDIFRDLGGFGRICSRLKIGSVEQVARPFAPVWGFLGTPNFFFPKISYFVFFIRVAERGDVKAPNCCQVPKKTLAGSSFNQKIWSPFA